MSLRGALSRFLPTDDGYAPFGQRWLEGMNVLALLLAWLAGLSWIASRVSFSLLTRHVQAIELAIEFAALVFVALLLVPMIVAVVAATNLTERSAPAARFGWIAIAVFVGSAVFGRLLAPLECALHAVVTPIPCEESDLYKATMAVKCALWGALLAAAQVARQRHRRVVRAEREARVRRLQAEGQEDEMRLLSLQAQIEQHFLFNSLAHVQRLYQVDPPRGRTMLQHLGTYMRSALPQMRERDSTLGRELALVQAYVGVQQVRMGSRLRAEFDVPSDLLPARLSPLMLLTLAENAVKHGISPRREGGALRIAARLRSEDARLEIEVLDDGVGLRQGAGSGIGLANTRARLATEFGAAGALEIGNRAEGGVRAALLLPFTAMSTDLAGAKRAGAALQ